VSRCNIKLCRGISAMIIEVLIIALTLIMVSLAVSWIMGLWHTTEETFMIRPMIQISYGSLSSKPVLKLYITNKGQRGDEILRVEIKAGSGYYVNTTTFNIPAGFSGPILIDKWSIAGSPKSLEPGDRCRIYIYTKEHGMLFYDIVVTSQG